MSCGVGHRHGSDLALLWLWRRLAATAPISPLAWELPYAAGAALKRQKRQKKKSSIVRVHLLLMNNGITDLNGEGSKAGSGGNLLLTASSGQDGSLAALNRMELRQSKPCSYVFGKVPG